jgi:hypothetical protein
MPITVAAQSSIIRGWYNRPISGRRTERTLTHLTPPQKKTKKRKRCNLDMYLFMDLFIFFLSMHSIVGDRLCGLVVGVLEVPGSTPGATTFSEKYWV